MILFLLLQAASAQPAASAAPAAIPWAVKSKTEATGTTSVSASTPSRAGNARLVVRCDHTGDNVVSIQFIPTPAFAKASPRPVSIQADGGATLGTNWEFPGNGAFTAQDAVVTTLSVAIATAKQIKVRAMDPANQPVDAIFDGPPSDAPVRQVLQACGYVLGQVPVRTPPPAAPQPEATP
jgi:hypothetical protein